MSRVCQFTGKRSGVGNRRSHAMNATKRKFRPNLIKKTMIVNGRRMKVTLSTRALRTLTKHMG